MATMKKRSPPTKSPTRGTKTRVTTPPATATPSPKSKATTPRANKPPVTSRGGAGAAKPSVKATVPPSVSPSPSSPQEPSAFPRSSEQTEYEKLLESMEVALSTVCENELAELEQEDVALPTVLEAITEEAETLHDALLASMMMGDQEATDLVASLNHALESTIDVIEAIDAVEKHLDDAFPNEDEENDNDNGGGLAGESDANKENGEEAADDVTESLTVDENGRDEGGDGPSAHDSAQAADDMADAHREMTEALATRDGPRATGGGVAPAVEYGSDDDDGGSSVYSFATTAASFAGDETLPAPMVSSPRDWDSQHSSPARPVARGWNTGGIPDWSMEQTDVQHFRFPRETDATQSDIQPRDLDMDSTATPSPSEVEVSSVFTTDVWATAATSSPSPMAAAPLSHKKPGNTCDQHHQEIRTADVVAVEPVDDTAGYEELTPEPETALLFTTPVAATCNTSTPWYAPLVAPPPVPVSPPASEPCSNCSTTITDTVSTTSAISYLQLSTEHTSTAADAVDDSSTFYRNALLRLKQERAQRRATRHNTADGSDTAIATATASAPLSPLSNGTLDDDEDDPDRRARLERVAELRTRTTTFEVKIGKPLVIARVPFRPVA